MPEVTKENLREHLATHDKQNSWWANDVMGIPLCRVCDACREVALSRYKPEVLGISGNYTDAVEEQIEPEDDDYNDYGCP